MPECRLVKTVAVCQSVGRKLESSDMFCWLSSPVAEATDSSVSR